MRLVPALLAFPAALASAACVAAPVAAPDAAPTLRADVVALVSGDSREGDPSLAVTHGGYRYLFATAENRATFEADPERYRIRLGGACARMGPLSGRGRPDIHTVHDDQVYIFASEACRETFLRDPAAVLDRDDPRPRPSPEEARRANELLASAADAVGGGARVDAVRTYAEWREEEVTSGDRTYRRRDVTYFAFPDRARTETWWDDAVWAIVGNGEGGHFVDDGGGSRDMAPSQRRALRAQTSRNLLSLLKLRDAPGTVVAHVGAGRVGTAPVELVEVWSAGVGTTLAIDPASGRVLSLRFRGRGPRMIQGDVERRLSDFRDVGGLSLPFTTTTLFDGEPVEGSSRTLTRAEVDADLDPGLFVRPRS